MDTIFQSKAWASPIAVASSSISFYTEIRCMRELMITIFKKSPEMTLELVICVTSDHIIITYNAWT